MKLNKFRSRLKVLLLLFVIEIGLYALLLIVTPNGVAGSSWLGYSRSRLLTILLCLCAVGLGIFWRRAVASQRDSSLGFWQKVFSSTWFFACALLALAATLFFLVKPLDAWSLQVQALLLYVRPSLVLAALVFAQAAIFSAWLRGLPGSEKAFRILLGALVIAYCIWRISNSMQFATAYTVGDSWQYLGESRWAEFWANNRLSQGVRPLLLPFLGTLLKQNPVYLAWLQTFLSIAAWSFLAVSFAKSFQSPLAQSFAVVGVLVFSLGRHIVVWDWTILAESISLSLMVVLLALWIRLVQQFSWSTAISIVIAALLWSLTRDINAWMVLLIGLVTLVAYMSMKLRREWLALSLGLVAVFLFSSFSANSSKPPRWTIPLVHSVIIDVLPNQQARQFFVEHGMPFSDRMERWHIGFPEAVDFWEDEEYLALRGWIVESGRGVYARYLIASLPASLLRPVATGFPIAQGAEFNRPFAYTSFLPDSVEGFFSFDLQNLPGRVLLLALLGLAVWRVVKLRDGLALVLLIATLLFLPYAVLAWYGDGLSKARHVLPADVLLRLGVWLLCIMVMNLGIKHAKTWWMHREARG